MSRPILSRPRTRVYGCNYDKGESYYKPMVDHLDRKYSSRPLFSEPRTSLADEIAARRSDIGTRDLSGPRSGSFGRDLDLEFDPRNRGSQLPSQSPSQPPPSLLPPPPPLLSSSSSSLLSPLITDPLLNDDEETVFDSRGQRTRRRFANDLASEFANEVTASTRRFKAKVAALGLDEELDSLIQARHQQESRASAALAAASTARKSAIVEEVEGSLKRRSKLMADELEEARKQQRNPTLTKWTKLFNEEKEAVLSSIPISAAATRAKQTKARLDDLETEMEELADRRAKRERRAAALRALVNESAVAAEDAALTSRLMQKQQSNLASSKKLSVRSERIDKRVAF